MKKRFFLFAIFFAVLFLFLNIPVRANRAAAATRPQSGDYACILTDNAFFYSTADDKRGIFLLPRTYYVRLLDYGEEYCRVEYLQDSDKAKRLVGYTKTQDLTFVDYTPQSAVSENLTVFFCHQINVTLGFNSLTETVC